MPPREALQPNSDNSSRRNEGISGLGGRHAAVERGLLKHERHWLVEVPRKRRRKKRMRN